MDDRHRPQRPLREKGADGNAGTFVIPGLRKGTDRLAPRQQPQKCDNPERDKDSSPSPMPEDDPARERACRRPERDARRDSRIGDPAPLRPDMPGYDLRASRKGYAFPEAQHDPEHE